MQEGDVDDSDLEGDEPRHAPDYPGAMAQRLLGKGAWRPSEG